MRDRLAEYLTVLGLAADRAEARLAAGQFHDVVLIGEVAYRFPRDEQSRAGLPAAVALLAALNEAGLPAAVPRPLDTSHLQSPLRECHVPLTRLPGLPLDQLARASRAAARAAGAGAPEAGAGGAAGVGAGGAAGVGVGGPGVQEAIVTDLAMLLDRLADLGSDPAIANLVPRTDPDHWPAFAAQVRDVLYPLMSPAGRRHADAELAAVTDIPATGNALVHTDLGGANLLWTAPPPGGGPRLAGVLDWDEAGIGDQASDLASIAVTVGWPLARQIDTGRHHNCHSSTTRLSSTRSLLADAMVIAATFALQQALPAALIGDQANLDDGLREYRT